MAKAETCSMFTTCCIALYLIIVQVYVYIWWLILLHETWIILKSNSYVLEIKQLKV
jgi:hypothetical protein